MRNTMLRIVGWLFLCAAAVNWGLTERAISTWYMLCSVEILPLSVLST